LIEWDKLWDSVPKALYELDNPHQNRMTHWLSQLRTEGDRINEKAKKWDEFIVAYKDRWVGKGLNEDQASQQAWEIISSWVKVNRELEKENKQLKRQGIQDHEDYGNLLDKKHELNQKLEAIHELGLCSLIADMREDLMGFYRHWQENRDFEDYHKPVKPSDMRAVRKYMQDFEHVESKLKELLGK